MKFVNLRVAELAKVREIPEFWANSATKTKCNQYTSQNCSTLSTIDWRVERTALPVQTEQARLHVLR